MTSTKEGRSLDIFCFVKLGLEGVDFINPAICNLSKPSICKQWLQKVNEWIFLSEEFIFLDP